MEPWLLAKRIAQGVLRRRKALVVGVFAAALLVVGPAAFYLSEEPPRYRTTATVLLESRPDRIPLFQEFSPFRPLPVQLAILRSRTLAESVLEHLPRGSFQEIADNQYGVDPLQELRNAYRRFRGFPVEVQSPQRRALTELQKARVTFETRSRDGIVRLHAEASRPQAAVDIANAYIEALLARTRSFNIEDARVTREFLEQQVNEVRKNLQGSEDALRQFTAGHGGVRVPEQSQATVARLSQAQTALAEVTANRRMVETRVTSLREKVATQERSAPAPAPPPRAIPPSVQRLRDQLTKLETALIDLRTRYTDEHPRVILVREQIADVQRELGAAVKDTTPATPAPGGVLPVDRVNFTEQVLALETSLHALIAQEGALQKQVESLRQSLTGLSKSEIEYSRLVRETESNRNLYALLSDRLTGARIREQGEMKVVKVIDPPGAAARAGNQKRFKFGAIALVLAAALGGGVPALVEWVRRPVEGEEDVEAATALPVLSVVPRLRNQPPVMLTARERRELQALGGRLRLGDHLLFTESFRTLRVAIQLAGRVEPIRTVLVTSAFPSEGKSTVLVNLGIELADAGQRVVLADTDFLRPSLHEALKVRNGDGLVGVLHGSRNLGDSLVPVGATGRLLVAPRGKTVRDDTRGLLATSRLGDVLEEMGAQADVVLCDSAPVLLVPDNLFLATAVDAVVLVVRAGRTGCRDLARAKAVLEGAGAKILGVVINEMSPARLKRYYRRYYKGYYAQAAMKEAS